MKAQWVILISLLQWGFSLADQIVYLDRPSNGSSFEPYFNPKTINAVNESVHFVARFGELSHAAPTFVPFVWAFAESDYNTPCTYNQDIQSGFFYLDPNGTWNGSSFTITVNNPTPRFFYMIRDGFVSNCSNLAGWSTKYNLTGNTDILFALNPDANHTFDGYKDNVRDHVNNSVTFEYYPRGGSLVVQSTNENITSNVPSTSGGGLSRVAIIGISFGAFSGFALLSCICSAICRAATSP